MIRKKEDEREFQKGLYLDAVERKKNKKFVDDDFRYNFDSNVEIPHGVLLSTAYFAFTKKMIEANNSSSHELPQNLVIGLSESLSNKLWFQNIDSLANSRDNVDSHWLQQQVGDALFANIGEEELAAILLKRPDLLHELLSSIELDVTDYNGERHVDLLSYLDNNLEIMCTSFDCIDMKGIGIPAALLNCMEAIDSSREHLEVFKRRRKERLEKREKQKIKSLDYERDFE